MMLSCRKKGDSQVAKKVRLDSMDELLHTRRPRNPYCIAHRGQVRKGIYRRTYMEEYERKYYKLGVPAPFSIAIGGGADG